MEVWKVLKDFENWYEVSNLGNIRNYKTKVLLKPRLNKDGYLRIGLRKANSRKIYSLFIHRLVALSFIPNLDIQNCTLVNHKDSNRINNNVSNLEWCTPSYNTKYSFHNGKSHKGSKNPNSKLREDQVLEIKQIIQEQLYKSCLDIAKKYGISRSTVNAIKNNKLWSNN